MQHNISGTTPRCVALVPEKAECSGRIIFSIYFQVPRFQQRSTPICNIIKVKLYYLGNKAIKLMTLGLGFPVRFTKKPGEIKINLEIIVFCLALSLIR